MPIFKTHLRRPSGIEPDELGIEFRDLHHAYLEVCKAIPDTAREMLIGGQDPMGCSSTSATRKGAG